MTERQVKVLAADTSKLQYHLSHKFLSNSTFESLYKSSNISPFVENSSDMMLRRLKHHRHPLSGISTLLPELAPGQEFDGEQIFKEVKSNHKLNSRILETWLNNTIEDAADLNLPEQVIKAETRAPLVRFGIDRTTLLNSGLQSIEVDRIYRGLFVYSIGFFQLVKKLLSHTKNQYQIITGIWKVYAILLEYCCQFDYEMIIKTLNTEKKEELTDLENEFKQQILKIEEHERLVVENFNQSKLQIVQLQKDLQDEIRKREELEDELLQRGSGHEEEVTMRLKFESKLNHMYAKIRDMESKLSLVNESLGEVEKLLNDRTDSLQEERKKNLALAQMRTEVEQDMKRVTEKSKQTESVNIVLEQRLVDCYDKIEELNSSLSNMNTQNNQALNDLAHQKIEIDDLKFSVETLKGQIGKQLTVIIELTTEKNVHTSRIKDLESTLNFEMSQNKHFHQEYVKIKEQDIVKTTDLEKYRNKAESLEKVLIDLEKERDCFKIQKESTETANSELKTHLKMSQVKIEELNKGRRVVEEANDSLKRRVIEREKEVETCRKEIFDLKDAQEKMKNHESSLQTQITSLNVRISSIEKQSEVARNTLKDKVNSLNEILESEKSVRQNWIYRYEEEQKSSSNITRELIDTQDKLNENVIKFNNLTASYQELQLSMEKLTEKFNQEVDENLELRAHNEEIARKLKTSQILLEKVDEDYKERFSEFVSQIDEMHEQKMEGINGALMRNEDMLQVVLDSIKKLEDTETENRRLAEIQAGVDQIIADIRAEERVVAELAGRQGMLLEDSRQSLISQESEIRSLKNNLKSLELEMSKVQKGYNELKNMVPAEFKNAANPFKALLKQIADLKNEIKFAEASKPILKDSECQYVGEEKEFTNSEAQTSAFYIESEESDHSIALLKTTEKFTQKKRVSESLDLGLRVLDKAEKVKKTPKSIANEIFLEKTKKVLREKDLTKESFDVRRENVDFRKESFEARRENKESPMIEDMATPLNMRSIYGEDEPSGKLPMISKRAQPNSMVALPQPISTVGEFKRFMKQAVSRRRNEKNSN